MKNYVHVFVVCAIFAVIACDSIPEDRKNNKKPVPENVQKLCEQSLIIVGKVQSCFKHISNELQTIRADTANGIEECKEAIHEDIISTHQAITEYLNSIEENLKFTEGTFKKHCEKASFIEYRQCIADSLEETKNARIDILRNIVEIRKVVAPRVRDMISSSKNCIRSVFGSAVKSASEIKCQQGNE